MRRISKWAAGLVLSTVLMGAPAAVQAAPTGASLSVVPSPLPAVHSARVDKVRIRWDFYKDAVRYRLDIWDSMQKKRLLRSNEWVSLPGREIDISSFRRDAALSMDALAWTVTPLDRRGRALTAPSSPKLLKDAEIRPEAPQPVCQYDVMEEAPLYLVYAWLAVPETSSYEVEVWRKGDNGGMDERVRHLYTYENILYDEIAMTRAGRYEWRVRALDGNGRRFSEWSEPQSFVVHGSVKYAALGDSITHGGGAISTPPCILLYNWETYAEGLTVKNLGFSGNTTMDMLLRFERDVLPFSPKVLVIMGGVNDFREGDYGSAIVKNLAQLRDKCLLYGITPVFVTATPIRPSYMAEMEGIGWPSSDWKSGQETVNTWVRQQPYFVDITAPLTDAIGELRGDYTSDGLHPDAEAKQIIGESIGRYLREHFER